VMPWAVGFECSEIEQIDRRAHTQKHGLANWTNPKYVILPRGCP
jgi:hypothetical protein